MVQSGEKGRVQPQMRSPKSSCPMVLMFFSCVMRAVNLFLWIRYLLELRITDEALVAEANRLTRSFLFSLGPQSTGCQSLNIL